MIGKLEKIKNHFSLEQIKEYLSVKEKCNELQILIPMFEAKR